jgi:hypothetical protein
VVVINVTTETATMKQLTSFRLPTDLKNQFATICRIKGTFMSTELIYLIEAFIEEQLNDRTILRHYRKQQSNLEPKKGGCMAGGEN